MAPPPSRLRVRLLALGVGLLAIPLLAELGARGWYSARYQDHTYALYPWLTPLALSETRLDGPKATGGSGGSGGALGEPVALTPGDHRVQSGPSLDHVISINDSGYRGPDFEEPRTAKWRVASIGGSSTFSGECSMGTAYPAVLEELLNERYGEGSAEVVNRGLSGASLNDMLDTVEHHVLPHSPDLITVYSAFNSLRLSTASVDLRPGAAPWHRQLFFGRSLYYTVLSLAYASRGDDAVRQEAGGPTRGQAFEQYERDLLALVEMTREAGVALLFVQQAMLEPARARPEIIEERVGKNRLVEQLDRFKGYRRRHQRLGTVMADVAEEHGIPVVDPRPALYSVPFPDEHFWVSIHLTEQGSRVLATEMDRQIAELGGMEAITTPTGEAGG